MGGLEKEKMNTDSIEIYALVGAAGTGKSHRALSLAHEIGVDLIIDDGLLIKGSRILAGRSAKSEKLIFTATRRALFQDPEHVREVKERLAAENPRRVLVLGISENMVRRISENLGLPQPKEIIPIEKLASEKELQTARRLRMVDKRHVVPVLSMDVNRNAVGQLIESFTVIFRKKNDRQVLGENSVVRPAYSSIGKITIAETVIKALSINSARTVKGVVDAQMLSLRVDEGRLTLDIGLKLDYGLNLRPVLEEVQVVVLETLTSLTGMTIKAVNVIARELALAGLDDKGRNLK